MKKLLFIILLATPAFAFAQSAGDLVWGKVNAGVNGIDNYFVTPQSGVFSFSAQLADGSDAFIALGSGLVYNSGPKTISVDPSIIPPSPVFYLGVSHSIVTSNAATGFQVSSARPSAVNYSVSVSTTATIGGASSGYVALEVAATNSTNPSDWTEVGRTGNSQTITLALTLNSVQVVSGQISGSIPIGYYCRLRSVLTGTSSTSYISGQETTL